MTLDDTIAAIASAAGVGGVGIVRVSGPNAVEIVAEMLGVAALDLDRTVRVGWARERDGTPIDQVLAFAMRAPRSFTGEDVAEVHGHGGAQNLGRLLAAAIERGARVAEPGEFTRRAVANGKLDLIRAEALLDVIHAGSERAVRLAQQNLRGRLGTEVTTLEQRALEILAEIEGRIDFPDDDLEVETDDWVRTELGRLRDDCAHLADSFRRGRAVSHGIVVALVGRVNVGKSSLLNALVGRERVLVAAEPGTTRDYVEIQDVWNGIAVTLIDTAGLRSDAGPIEQRGIALGESRVESADVVVVVNDAVAPWEDGSRWGERALVIRSKCDLVAAGDEATRTAGRGPNERVTAADRASEIAERGPNERITAADRASEIAERGPNERITAGDRASEIAERGPNERITAGSAQRELGGGEHERSSLLGARSPARTGGSSAVQIVRTSAATGEGLDALRQRVLELAGVADREGSEQPLVTTARQQAAAAEARDGFAAAQRAWIDRRAFEIVALEIRTSTQALARLRGTEVGERILDELFSRFCIGK